MINKLWIVISSSWLSSWFSSWVSIKHSLWFSSWFSSWISSKHSSWLSVEHSSCISFFMSFYQALFMTFFVIFFMTFFMTFFMSSKLRQDEISLSTLSSSSQKLKLSYHIHNLSWIFKLAFRAFCDKSQDINSLTCIHADSFMNSINISSSISSKSSMFKKHALKHINKVSNESTSLIFVTSKLLLSKKVIKAMWHNLSCKKDTNDMLKMIWQNIAFSKASSAWAIAQAALKSIANELDLVLQKWTSTFINDFNIRILLIYQEISRFQHVTKRKNYHLSS